jgi:hypothetical protein
MGEREESDVATLKLISTTGRRRAARAHGGVEDPKIRRGQQCWTSTQISRPSRKPSCPK